ncbi:MAG: trigger factor [Defluviitaleaceae bacterium]|nr:trigger factor [Defluviitaleaceae bacterium]MCL2262093.1 trigger factor [Defluviitaleaceae bacterium]
MASAKKSKTTGLVSSEMEKLEGTKIKITITVSAERLREGLHHVYSRNKQYFNIPGFRKGKAPRKMIEQLYGRDVFHDDAINFILPDIYEEVLEKHEIEPVYRPDVDPGEICEKEGATFVAIVHVRPEAQVGEYAGLTYPNTSAEATEEDIENALKAEQEKNARLLSVNRPAELKDVVTINFKGFMDGEPFEGGSNEDHDLTLGSGQFIPGFEEQVVGHVPGDEFNVEVTFPEDYHAPEFAGKAATFEVEILDVKANELPEIDDEFAEDVSEFDTLAEFKDDLAKKITERNTANLDNRRRNHVLKKLAETATVEIPEEMYLGRLDDMFFEFSRSIQMRGMDVENYMRFTGTSEEFLRASWRKQAEDDVKGMLTLEAVAVKENLTVDEEDFTKRVEEATGKEGDELAKVIEEMQPLRRKELERSLLCEKALELIMEKAVASDDDVFEEVEEDDNEEQGEF